MCVCVCMCVCVHIYRRTFFAFSAPLRWPNRYA